ncbi:MAG: hypothetical protein NC548_06110 [Lachnospiraceae bacterium]|nr:hypothetical protein [Lachnospiraceae bacterium]
MSMIEYVESARRICDAPQDPVTRDFLYAIDRQTKIDVAEQFGVTIDRDWWCNTIANNTVEAIIKALATDMQTEGAPRASLNFYDLFIAQVTTKRNTKAEKEGNINISFQAGPTAEALITEVKRKDQQAVEQVRAIDFFHIEDPDADQHELELMNQAYLAVDTQARYAMSQNYGIVLGQNTEMVAFAICYTFIKNIFSGLLLQLGENPEQTLATVNFNDNIEFHALIKDGGVILSMRPGMNAKLLIKSDAMTEATEWDSPLSEEVPWDD